MSLTQDITNWIQIFINANSPDQAISKPANDSISDKINNGGDYLIGVISQILIVPEKDENTLTAKGYASSFLLQMLSIKNISELEINRKNISSEKLEMVKSSLKQNIFSENSTIRQNCIKSYSCLVATLTANWPDGINDIIISIKDEGQKPSNFIYLVILLRKIVKQINFVDEIYKEFKSQFSFTFEFCIKNSIRSENSELVNESIKYCTELIDCDHLILSENCSNIPGFLDDLLSSIKCDNDDIYDSLLDLFISIVKSFYYESPTFIEKISLLIENYLNPNSKASKRIIKSIYFWHKIAEFEKKKIEKVKIDEKLNRKTPAEQRPHEPLLIEAVKEKLIPIMIYFIEDIDEKNIDVEKIDILPEPSMYAVVCLKTFYSIFTEAITNIIKEKIEENFAKKDKWTNINAAILLIYSISENPVNPNLGGFINEHITDIIEAASKNQIPRLRENSLYLLFIIVSKYNRDLNSFHDVIQSLIENVLIIDESKKGQVLSQNDLLIFSRYALIIFSCLENLYDFSDEFYEKIDCLLNIGIINNNKDIIDNSSEALNQLIMSLTSPEKIVFLFKKTLDMLTESNTAQLLQETRFILQSFLFSNISALLIQMGKNISTYFELIQENAQKILHVIYDILSNKNIYIYNEGLLAISELIKVTNVNDYTIELFTKETLNRLLTEFIYTGLTSFNSAVVTSSCIAIGFIYYFLLDKYKDLIDLIPDIFRCFSDIVLNHDEIRDSHPIVFNAIADILSKIDSSTELKDLEQFLRDLFTKVSSRSKKLDITDNNDVEFGNIFYKYLTKAFGSYARLFYDNNNFEHERLQLVMLDQLSFYIIKLIPKVNDDLYLQYCQTLRLFAQNCSRRNNTVLNNRSNMLIRMGSKNCKKYETRRALNDILQYIRNK